MTKNFRFLAIGLVGVTALLLPLKADAACGSISFGSYYARILGTNQNATSPTLRSNFWIMTVGNPAVGQGNDNGNVTDEAAWVSQYGTGTVVLGDWGTRVYDGCADAVQPLANQRMAFSFSDVDVAGNMVWAAACVKRIGSQPQQFDLGTVGGNLTMVPALRAGVTNTVRAGNEATITVGAPNFTTGFYTDGSVGCEEASVIPQYDVYKQQTARGVAPSATNDAGTTWVKVCTASSGQPCTFTTTCGTTDCDNYLAVSPRFNGSFDTGEAATGAAARVGQNSIKVQAGPTLAVTPKPRTIPNPRIGGPKAGQQ
jgi:hypothetical protein